MDQSDFVDAHGTVWRIYAGLPAGYPETGERTAGGQAQAGLTFRATTGEVRVLPRAAIPHRAHIPPLPTLSGVKQPAVRPDTPTWDELLQASLPWPPA